MRSGILHSSTENSAHVLHAGKADFCTFTLLPVGFELSLGLASCKFGQRGPVSVSNKGHGPIMARTRSSDCGGNMV